MVAINRPLAALYSSSIGDKLNPNCKRLLSKTVVVVVVNCFGKSTFLKWKYILYTAFNFLALTRKVLRYIVKTVNTRYRICTSLSTLGIGAAQFRSFTEVAPKRNHPNYPVFFFFLDDSIQIVLNLTQFITLGTESNLEGFFFYFFINTAN